MNTNPSNRSQLHHHHQQQINNNPNNNDSFIIVNNNNNNAQTHTQLQAKLKPNSMTEQKYDPSIDIVEMV